jgi:2-amino-4-hydroxy-6-hydroxymethyldihydropteridine diphosphokinase
LIIKAAPVYTSAADGFEGDEFYNTVILVHTALSPKSCLKELKKIEAEMGRHPQSGEGYENRIIDLDIILYEDRVIVEDDLQIPHPRAAERNFVLQPLLEIDPDLINPHDGKHYSESLIEQEKLHVVEDFEITLSRKRYPLHHYNFIAIEGNIGSGKTSLSTKLAQDFNGNLILERFKDNPFLPLFYKDQERYSFPLEMSFLADRYQQLSDELGQHNLFSDVTIADYYVVKSLIFSRVTLNSQEYELYRRLFYLMYKELTKPDLYVYLYQNDERLLQNIQSRGRVYEKGIKPGYLKKIHEGYMSFLRSQKELNALIIDVTELDFVKSQNDYMELILRIKEKSKVC